MKSFLKFTPKPLYSFIERVEPRKQGGRERKENESPRLNYNHSHNEMVDKYSESW